MASSPDEIRKHLKLYWIIGLILFVFTVVTYIVATHPFFDFHNHGKNMALGLAIAAFKATLVALIFMHLNNERGLIYKFLLFTVIFFGAMMFLFVLAITDPLHFHLMRDYVH